MASGKLGSVKKIDINDEKFKRLTQNHKSKDDDEMNEKELKMRFYKRVYMREFYRKNKPNLRPIGNKKYYTEEELKESYRRKALAWLQRNRNRPRTVVESCSQSIIMA